MVHRDRSPAPQASVPTAPEKPLYEGSQWAQELVILPPTPASKDLQNCALF